MTFDEWLEDRRRKFHHPVYGSAHIEAAWNYQQARIKELEAALLEAADDIADWGQYAGDYFMEKHGLDDDVAKYRSIANRESGE